MPPKIQSKPIKQIVEELSENDSNSDNETEITVDESDDELDNNAVEEKKDTNKELKEKLKKLSHEEVLTEIEILNKENIQLDNDINDLDKLKLTKDRLRNSNRKKLNKLISLLPKAYTDGCNKARKEKVRRTNSARSGILREKEVPQVLIKYLNLPDNDVKSQSKLFHLLNEEFKKRNLKRGQQTALDKYTAELFGFKEGHIIEFKDHQRFLSDILNNEKKKTNEVSL